MKPCLVLNLLTTITLVGLTAGQTPDWPEFYDPTSIRHLHFKIKSSDMSSIRNDETFEVEVPAMLWEEADGEAEAVLVSVRRKSADPIGDKISYKIDINEYEGHPEDTLGLAKKKWHELKKLSLENGDDNDVVAEQLAWFINMAAANDAAGVYPEGHIPGMSNFATLTAHVVSGGGGMFDFSGNATIRELGVYVNVEQPDKQYLKNRLAWEGGQTYLYKQSDLGQGGLFIKESGCEEDASKVNSPTYESLSCAPFLAPSGKGKTAVVPPDCTCDQLNLLIDMDVMLSQAAIEAFISSPDDMFSKGKNFYFVDYSDDVCSDPHPDGTFVRKYYQWDLDSTFNSVNSNVYAMILGGGGGGGGGGGKPRRVLKKPTSDSGPSQTEFQRVIFGCQQFLDIFNSKLTMLTDDSEGSVLDRLSAYAAEMKPILAPYLTADPNSKGAGGSFDRLVTWFDDRRSVVESQLCSDASKSGLCD